jgi:hypothetical protein
MVTGRPNPNEVFYLDNKIVEKVDLFRYLGAMLSRTADWGPHVESRIALCRSRSNFIAEQIKQLAHASAFTTVTMWKAVCRPVLEYGFESAVLNQGHLAEMDKVQFQFFQRALLLPLQTPQVAVFAELGIRPMGERLDRLRIGMAFDILNKMSEQRIPKQLFSLVIERGWAASLDWFKQLFELLSQLGDDVLPQSLSVRKADGSLYPVKDARRILLRRVSDRWQANLLSEVRSHRLLQGHYAMTIPADRPRCRERFWAAFRRAHDLAESTNDVRGLTSLLKLRLGCNELLGSCHTSCFTGQWIRTCIKCRMQDETPLHFLLKCSSYVDVRSRFFGRVGKLFACHGVQDVRLAMCNDDSKHESVMFSLLMLEDFDRSRPRTVLFDRLKDDDRAKLCLVFARYISALFGICGSRFH